MKTKDRSPYEMKTHRFPLLVRRFEQEYGHAYDRLADHLKEDYPDITRKGRRTARALRNICFFVWWYTGAGESQLIPVLFNASVLLSAQDDYYDNPRIRSSQKETFRAATNHAIRTGSFQSVPGRSRQTRELMSLWSDVARSIRAAPPSLQSYWQEKACQLNDAMARENRAARRTDLGIDEYMHTAIHSIGIVFVWATYLVHKGVPLKTLRDMDPALLLGAEIVRLSNDIASYRRRKNKRNAVTMLGGERAAERSVIQLITERSDLFRERIDELPVGPDVKRVMLRSTSFLTEFYQRSDFDKRPLR